MPPNVYWGLLAVWDKKMVDTQFNWYWHHTPTFEPYKYEGMFFPLILAHGNTTQSAKTATIVLQSLTPNAQSIFRVLAEHQMAHPNEEGKLGTINKSIVACNCFLSMDVFFLLGFQGCQSAACTRHAESVFW